MILADNQSGSKELIPYIQRLTPEVVETRVDPPYGDFVWVGNGPGDKAISVAVEYKQFSELLNSIIDGRFAGHQVEGLVNHYDRRYLLIEEPFIRTDRDTGNIQRRRGDKWEYVERNGRPISRSELDHWITTIEEQAGFRVMETQDRWQSARWIVNKHDWYMKEWDKHAGLKQFHTPPPPAMVFSKPNLVRRWAKELEGIGWEKSLAAANYFQTPLALALGNEEDWRRIDGVGPVLSERVVKAIRGEK